jgi:C-terminal processing protease CtpA/Prc
MGGKPPSGGGGGGNKSQILVESVKPASIADRCGAIYVGDQILSIDDVPFENISLSEAVQILDNCVGEFSRVEILPLSQNSVDVSPLTSKNGNTNSLNRNSNQKGNFNLSFFF